VTRIALAVMFAGPLPVAAQLAPASVPPAVQQGLMQKYPGIERAAWSAAGGSYVGVFRTSGAEVSAMFTVRGEWIESAMQIGAITLPDTVRKFIVHAYKGYRFGDVRRIDRARAPTTLYEVHLDKAGENVIVKFEANGKIFAH
jgi:hypothetical protein